jgi:hypothetical protein
MMAEEGVPMSFSALNTCSSVVISSDCPARYGDVLQRKLAAKGHECAFSQPVFLEQELDRLKVIDARQVHRVFVPPFKALGTLDVALVLDMGE